MRSEASRHAEREVCGHAGPGGGRGSTWKNPASAEAPRQPSGIVVQPCRNAGLAMDHRSISSPAKAARSWMKVKRASGLLPISRSTVSEVASLFS